MCDFYRTSRLPYAHLIGKISHENDNDFLPLQAADLEAWLTRRTLSGLVDADRECFSPIRSLTPVSYTIKQADVEYFVAKIWSGMQTLVIPTVGTRKKLHPFFKKMIVGGLDR